MPLRRLKDAIAEKVKCKAYRVFVTEINGSKFEEDSDENASIFEAVKNYPSSVIINYRLGIDFNDIVTCFTASGIVSDKLIKLLGVDNIQKLREM